MNYLYHMQRIAITKYEIYISLILEVYQEPRVTIRPTVTADGDVGDNIWVINAICWLYPERISIAEMICYLFL